MGNFFRHNNWNFLIKNHAVRWNFCYLALMTIICLMLAFKTSWILGTVLLAIAFVGIWISAHQLRRLVVDTEEYINNLTYQVQRGQQEALLEMPIGMVMLNHRGIVSWINPYMARYFQFEHVVGKPLTQADDELAKLIDEHRHDKGPAVVSWRDHRFEFLVQDRYHVCYLLDVTKYEQISERYQHEQIFLGNIYLDNYIELTQGMNDSAVSNLHNYVTSELSHWAKDNHLLLRVINEDNYFVIGHYQSLVELEKQKFKILDVIRENTSKQNSPVTLSVGIAYGQSDLIKLADMAQRNLDLALGRGGDQVVVREEDHRARFYGGRTNPMEKRTRVRARMISQALQELMTQADQVFVMGHSNPDMDSLGACLGIRRIAEMNGHECWIVLDKERVHSDIARLMMEINDYQSIRDRIITPDEAINKATDSSLLVMVDHSKPSMSISPQLYERLADRTIIIDHHRRGEEFPENPLLVYIEPYASSTCELITEMFEYQPRESESLNKLEATAMLTGIQIDTKSFTQQAGTRTFEAASYLRSAGADGLMIQYFMKENVHSFMERNHLIATVEFLNNDKMALCAGEDDRTYDPVIVAQAADTLLQMDGVDASFVVAKRANDKVGISARSMGNINVQIIMEKMGGGGHLANAATQIAGKTVSEVKAELIRLLTTGDQSEDETEKEY